ncbi:GAP family protein [Compostimonas suwonensis]|uniref:Sap-like sulfolipid-1-addressing protein n=1 Tax=Compostimonas suwonensis TaxID=1048394 RepID=A0A2M9BVF3_9MICO|nr:GAP family protein [Compostimonas suwonensis]PJJ61922.1 Sap-like sulfolipid-1-addressing protein [Compostimonas suwonensis]
MGGALGEALPLALGIAVSPIPIIAAILMLLSPKAKGTSVGFLLGWMVGIIVAVTVFTLLSNLIPASDPSDPKPTVGVIKIVLGVLLLLLAVRQWRSRPKEGATAALPKWMAAIDTMTTLRGLGLGFLLSAVNPKNLLLAVAAGLAIGADDLAVGSTVLVIVIFTIIASLSIAIPVIAYLVATKRMEGPLERLRGWLVQNNAVVMGVLLLVMGVVVIGKGIANL